MLQTAIDLTIIVTLWASVGGHAMAHAPATVVAPLRRVGLVGRVAAFDMLVIPLVTAALVRLLGIDDEFAIGLLLFGAASAGVIGLVAVQTARGDLALALALVALLEAANAVAVPVWAALLLPRAVDVPVGQVLWVLIVYVLVPTVAGITLRAVAPRAVARLMRPTQLIAFAGLALVIVLVVIRDAALFGRIIGAGVPVVALTMAAIGLGGGWIVAGGPRATRAAVALVTAQRGSAVALAVAVTSFADSPGAAGAVIVAGMLTLIVVTGVAAILRRQVPDMPPEPVPAAR